MLYDLIEGYYHRKQVRDLMKEYLCTSDASQIIFYTVIGYDGIMKAMESHIFLKTT